jgi:hypothetical protein
MGLHGSYEQRLSETMEVRAMLIIAGITNLVTALLNGTVLEMLASIFMIKL